MTGQDGIPQKPRLTGEELAASRVEQLVILNERIGQLIQVTSEHNALADELCGHFDVVHLAMDHAKGLEGKVKPTIVDFAKCWVEAADEILPEDEEDDGGIRVPLR